MLLLVLLITFAFRLHGIHFGLPALNDPDELMFELGAIRMLRGPTLNPGWFGHPATTTMYLLAVVDALVFVAGWLAGWFPTVKSFAEAIYADPSWMIVPGRVAMAGFGAGCVFLTWRLGRALFGTAAGMVAAALLALSPVHIAWSQVIRSDIMATFFLLLCLLAALRVRREGRWRDHVVAALWLGAAIATKWPFAVGGLAIAGAVLSRVIERRDPPLRALARLAATMALALAFLLLLSPYLLLDHATVLRNLQGEAQVRHLGATGHGVLGNAWWYLSGPLASGLGILGLLLAAAGTALLAKRRDALAVVVPVALGFFVLICVQRLVWQRWALPLLPLLAIAAGLGAAGLWTFAARRLSRPWAPALSGLSLLALLLPLATQSTREASARLNDTRQQASRWADAHIPPGSTVLIEHFAFDMLAQPVRLQFPIGDAGCVDVRELLRGKTGYAPIESARGTRSNVDYGTLPPGKRETCRVDYAILAHYDRYRHEREHFPAEYASYRELLSRGRIVAAFRPSAGIAAGPVVHIVRMRR